MPPRGVQKTRIKALGLAARPIVVDLVIVPGHDPRHGRMRGLQTWIGLVLRIARTVVDQRIGLGAGMATHQIIAPGAFVNVVTHKAHQIGRIGDQMRIGIEPALLEMLTRA